MIPRPIPFHAAFGAVFYFVGCFGKGIFRTGCQLADRAKPIMLLRPHSDAYSEHGRIAVLDSDAHRRARVSLQCASRMAELQICSSLPELMTIWQNLGLILVHDENDHVAQAAHHGFESGHPVPVIAYAENPTTTQVVNAMKAGASDYLAFPFEGASIKRILDQALRGSFPTSISSSRSSAAKCTLDRLSNRERQVLEALSKGLTNLQIAEDLAISARTVETHRYNLRRKLGSIRTAQAIRLMVELSFEENDRMMPSLPGNGPTPAST